jgi:hypothetical protein
MRSSSPGERAYWENSTPIGFIFVFGSVMGLVVGMVMSTRSCSPTSPGTSANTPR